MYLSQMANIPAAYAGRGNPPREENRSSPASDFAAICCGHSPLWKRRLKVLERVHAGELPFDRTIKVSLTERLTKEQVQARMPH